MMKVLPSGGTDNGYSTRGGGVPIGLPSSVIPLLNTTVFLTGNRKVTSFPC
jgi:hypothetical protein